MRNSDRLPVGKQENYIEQNYRLKQEAKVLAEKFKDIKPTKYLLK
jgi:hypothetical protein